MRTVALGVWVLHGAAHDPDEHAGATHMVEHLTLRRCGGRDRHELATLVDRLGGEVDAWTSSEAMGVMIHTTRDAFDEAAALLREAILKPTFRADDVELERQVALAELELMADDPSELVEDAILRAAWGDHPLARPIIGTRDTLLRLTPEVLRDHHTRALLRGDRILFGAAGDIGRDDVIWAASGLPGGADATIAPLRPVVWTGAGETVARSPSDQVHSRLAFPGLEAGHPDLPALAILNRILGAGASSRLFQRLREHEGLTYDIWSDPVVRRSAGVLEVGWACSPERAPEVRRLVLEELARARVDLAAAEVEVASEGAQRGLLMDAESPGGLLAMEVAERLEYGRSFDLDLALERVRTVTLDRVRVLAAGILRPERMAWAVCGPTQASHVA